MANILRKNLSFDFVKAGEQTNYIDPIISFTRASTATKISPITDGLVENIAANVARLCGKQELWKAGSKNLLIRNAELKTWGSQNSPIVTDNVLNVGGRSFSLITSTGSSGANAVQTISSFIPTSYVFTCYVKSYGAGTQDVQIQSYDGTTGIDNGLIKFTLPANGSIPINTQQSYTATWITPVDCGNGVWRIGYTGTVAATNHSVNFYLNANPVVSTVGVGAYFAEPMVEDGTSATFYEPNPVVKREGLLIEGAATNLCPYSNLWEWYNDGTNVKTADATTAPDGTLTALRATGGGYVYTIVSNPDVTCVFSVWAKSPTAGATMVMSGSATPVALSNDWRRYYSVSAGGIVSPSLVNLPSDVYLWGAQLETGTFPTSYIPTAGAAVTRAADVATIDVSKIWNPNEGTIVCEANLSPVNSEWNSIIDTTVGQRLLLQRNNTGSMVMFGSGITTMDLGSVSGRCRIALAYSAGTLKVSMNGAAVTSNTIAAITPTVFYLGENNIGGEPLTSPLQSLQYHRFAFDDKTLQYASTLK